MPQQSRPAESPSDLDVEDEAVGEANPVVEDGPEDFYNAFQELIDWALYVLNNHNRAAGEPEVPDRGPRRVGLRARPGEILMPVGFGERAVVGDNFHQRFHRAAIFERPNDEHIIEDIEAGQVVDNDQPIAGAEQLVERVEGDQEVPDAQFAIASEAERLATAEAGQRLVVAGEADQRVEMAAEVVQRPVEVPRLVDEFIHRLAESVLRIAVAANAIERPPIVAEANQRLGMVAEATQGLGLVAEAFERLAMVGEADQQVAMVGEADQQVAMVGEADQQVAMVEADQQGAIDVKDEVTLYTQANRETKVATEADQGVAMLEDAKQVKIDTEDSQMVAKTEKQAAECPDAGQEAAECPDAGQEAILP